MTEKKNAQDTPAGVALGVMRRSAHALRNAQNAAVVNLEVVRTRSSAGGANEALRQFTDNAAKGIEDAARLADAMLAVASALICALAEGNLSLVEDPGGKHRLLELQMSPDAAGALITSVRAAGDGLGVGIKASARGAILRIPREHEAK